MDPDDFSEPFAFLFNESQQELARDEQVLVADDSIEERYGALLSMFPNIDQDYIKEICVTPPFKTIDGDVMVMLINHLLGCSDQVNNNLETTTYYDKQNKSNETLNDALITQYIQEELQEEKETMNDFILSEMLHIQDLETIEQERANENSLNEQLFTEFLQNDKQSVDEKMRILINILPDACPETMRKFVEQNHENVDTMQQLVENFLEDGNYTKRDQYFATKKVRENLEQYTSAFSVKEFLNKFPEPFEYFEDVDRPTVYDEMALGFLKNKYLCYNVEYIMETYSNNNYNLSLTDRNLNRGLHDTAMKLVPIQMKDAPISLLQEIAFIENRAQLQSYLHKEAEEMRILKLQKLLLECQCCYSECKPYDIVECEDGHLFCTRCIIRGTEVAISQGQAKIECFTDCGAEISLPTLRKVLPSDTYEALFKIHQEEELRVANLENLEKCRFCSYSMELAPEIEIFTCKNPECMKITCRLCQKPNHLPFKCKDVLDKDKARHQIEEAMSKALIRYCHKCQKPFVKLDGCNKMTCPCGASMCYLCHQPISDYNHFERAGGCQTHTNSAIFDQERIEMSRVQTTARIQRDFPDLDIPNV
ncbi:hypothetical protein QAD02_014708 [Eretmocerus hayati]|uniref:Uncharacterized protein n=1 Tax=Eretmocerus hayati TaxID=131215 RepID=A0ACC2P663_9HYME|nr:hypothetical protein QAD02_014708 [Eretmocerus hayati]